jgi:hypothetical protein
VIELGWLENKGMLWLLLQDYSYYWVTDGLFVGGWIVVIVVVMVL